MIVPQCDHSALLEESWWAAVDATVAFLGRRRPVWAYRVAHALPCRRAASWSIWSPPDLADQLADAILGEAGEDEVRFACSRHVRRLAPPGSALSPVPGSMPAIGPSVRTEAP